MSELIMTEEAGTPATPGTNQWKIYPKSDGFYVLDDFGNEIPLMQAGTYTPTLTNDTNIAASVLNGSFLYSRVGAIVNVAGSVQIDPTLAAPTNTILGISLPIASNFTDSFDLSGNASNPNDPNPQLASIIADSANDRANLSYFATDAANKFWRIMFIYRVK